VSNTGARFDPQSAVSDTGSGDLRNLFDFVAA
jgi:hypothetical protein